MLFLNFEVALLLRRALEFECEALPVAQYAEGGAGFRIGGRLCRQVNYIVRAPAVDRLDDVAEPQAGLCGPALWLDRNDEQTSAAIQGGCVRRPQTDRPDPVRQQPHRGQAEVLAARRLHARLGGMETPLCFSRAQLCSFGVLLRLRTPRLRDLHARLRLLYALLRFCSARLRLSRAHLCFARARFNLRLVYFDLREPRLGCGQASLALSEFDLSLCGARLGLRRLQR